MKRQAEDWEKFIVKKRGRLQICPEWRLLAWRNSRWASLKWGSTGYLLVRGTYLAFSGWPYVEAGTKKEGIHQLLIEFWLFGADWIIVWLPGSVARDSALISYESDNSRLAFWEGFCR